MFGFAKMTVLQFAGIGGRTVGSDVLGLFARESEGDGGRRSQIVVLYDELRPLLYSNLVFLGFNPTEADDVIQDAFLGLIDQLTTGRDIEHVRGWVFRAAYSLALNVERQQRRIGLTGVDAEIYAQGLAAKGLNPEQECLSQEQMQRYETAVEKLTSQQQQCLMLRKEGLRYREIAVALHISPSRVPQLLQLAVSRLVEELYG